MRRTERARPARPHLEQSAPGRSRLKRDTLGCPRLERTTLACRVERGSPAVLAVECHLPAVPVIEHVRGTCLNGSDLPHPERTPGGCPRLERTTLACRVERGSPAVPAVEPYLPAFPVNQCVSGSFLTESGPPARRLVRSLARRPAGRGALAVCLLVPALAWAQAIDLSHGGPVNVTALGGIDWDQAAQTVTAHEDARAVRGNATVTADMLVAHYRKKAGAAGSGAPPAGGVQKAAATAPAAAPADAVAPATEGDTGNNEIYRLNAEGHVHIYTQTDQAWGDHAVYDIDQSVLVLTGHGLKLTTPSDLLTARDAMEYWSARHMAVARGDASATSNDGRRITGDVLVGYTADPNAPRRTAKPPSRRQRRRPPPAPTLTRPASCSGWRRTAT